MPEVTKLTKSQEVAKDIVALLRARNPILWIVTKEEARVELQLFQAFKAANYEYRSWDCDQGIVRGKINGKPVEDTNDIGVALSTIRNAALAKIPENEANAPNRRGAWILRDVPAWLDGLIGISTVRRLRNLAKLLPSIPSPTSQAIIILSPSNKVPPELENHVTLIDWPLPDRAEIGKLLSDAIESVAEARRSRALPAGVREPAIEAALGLSGEETQACFARSLVQFGCIDPIVVAKEKKRIVAREGVLEWYDPLAGGLDAVGGLENLKAWLKLKAIAFSPEAKAAGLRAPKGALLVGIPGCGKSMTAKAIATAWGLPLLRIDLGGLKGKFVGESEGNLRRAINVIEAIGRCIVWIDEIEKALAGATQGAADGGVSADALGTILSWMQERKGESFVVATANDVTSLPPELMRKGRFDDVWFVDLPNELERREIIKASLKAFNCTGDIDVALIATKTNGFTGVEIAELVPDAMFTAFADGARAVSTNDLVAMAKDVTPLSKTTSKRIEDLREWAKGRARPATRKEDLLNVSGLVDASSKWRIKQNG